MSKPKKHAPPCDKLFQISDFGPRLPLGLNFSPSQILQQRRVGQFPKGRKLFKYSPILFSYDELIGWARERFESAAPGEVERFADELRELNPAPLPFNTRKRREDV